MAIYRNISIKFWSDSKVMDLFSPEDKYFMLYCLTNSYTNLCGCYEVSIKQMSKDTGYNEETIRTLLERFTKKYKMIGYDFDTNELLIENWHKYNWTSSQKLDKPLLNDIKAIKSLKFKEYLKNLYNKRDTVSIPYTYPSDTTVSVTVSDTVTDTVSDTVSVNDNTLYCLLLKNARTKKDEYSGPEFGKVVHAINWAKQQPEFAELTNEQQTKLLAEV